VPSRSTAPSQADLRLLQDLAREAGAAAHAVRLTSDLQRSRERLVVARVVIADDQPIFRDGLRGTLNSEADTEVVAEAATGEEAVEAATAHQPDVVVMDLHMPGLNGIEATRHIVHHSPHIGVLVFTRPSPRERPSSGPPSPAGSSSTSPRPESPARPWPSRS
jgi:CheY-like chemotaxis protein